MLSPQTRRRRAECVSLAVTQERGHYVESRQRSAERTLRTLSVWGRTAFAFSLAETLLSVVLVGGIVVVALTTVGNATLVQRKISDRARGQLLAQDLMSEVLHQPYEDPNETPVFGRESTELSASRADYDDVDDYNGWDGSPPQQKDGTAKSGLSGWRRQVTIEYADATDLRMSSVSDSGIKRITVTASRDGVPMAVLTAIRTRAADVSAAER